MKHLILSVAIGSLALAGVSLALAAESLPTRKPGNWETSTESSMMAGHKMVIQQCIDKSTDANLLARAEQHGADCSPAKISRTGSQVVVENTCRVEGSTAVTRGVFNGDFEKAYQGEILTRFSPPLQGMSETRMKLEARWTGPCAPGDKPGSSRMKVPGMGEIDIEQMMKNMPGMRGQ